MGKTYKLDRERNIGTVIFILEGAKTEFDLLESVFVNILGYQVRKLKRNSKTGDYILQGHNSNSQVIGLNLKGNHLGDINDMELNALFHWLSFELGVKPEAAAIYYLYDRDVLSYEEDEVRSYVTRYQAPTETRTVPRASCYSATRHWRVIWCPAFRMRARSCAISLVRI